MTAVEGGIDQNVSRWLHFPWVIGAYLDARHLLRAVAPQWYNNACQPALLTGDSAAKVLQDIYLSKHLDGGFDNAPSIWREVIWCGSAFLDGSSAPVVRHGEGVAYLSSQGIQAWCQRAGEADGLVELSVSGPPAPQYSAGRRGRDQSLGEVFIRCRDDSGTVVEVGVYDGQSRVVSARH